MGKYKDQVRKDANIIATIGLLDEIVAEVLEKKGPTDKVHNTDYPSGDIRVPAIPTYSLWDAADVLEELNEFEETDSAYWEGKGVREALKIAASLTYRNAVRAHFTKIIDVLNDALGNMEIPWTLEDRYRIENELETGVLEWDPNYKRPALLPARQQDRLEKEHQKKLIQELQTLVRHAVSYV